jgi:hypothetical protein
MPDKAYKPVFANQGEQEDYWAKKLFTENYKQQDFKKYNGEIKIIDSNHYHFGNATLQISGCDPKFKSIFINGLIYPSLFGTDTLRIANIEQPAFLNTSFKIKRFRFWGWTYKLANPTVYFFEITNNKATKNTTVEDFIKGAKLTFVKQGWIII